MPPFVGSVIVTAIDSFKGAGSSGGAVPAAVGTIAIRSGPLAVGIAAAAIVLILLIFVKRPRLDMRQEGDLRCEQARTDSDVTAAT